jgi:ABC-type antimicrobial peptide transport system permease subunit
MDERIGSSVRMQRFQTTTIAALGVLGALVASIGVYAVRAHTVRARMKDLGIRMALGASRGTVLRLVMGETSVLVGVGLALGLGVAVWLTSFVEAWLFATDATDPAIFAAAAALLGAAALLAAWIPAQRAARIDPLSTLRQDG